MAEESKIDFFMYCKLVAERIAAASSRNDKQEALRLFNLLQDECETQIEKLKNLIMNEGL